MRAAVAAAVGLALLSTPAPADTAPAALPPPPRASVSVFNFQLTSGPAEWAWLEKFLADQITADFARSGGLSVVARDEMQALARELKWVPELATADADAAGRIKQALKIEYLVSGTVAVKDDQVEITGQIVDIAARKEVFRKTVRGKIDAVLELRKQLSAELLARLTKRPAGEVLPELPVWTRSIPAARALYVGMDLYDQGRYAEAWLSFRQAAREDKAYLDAAYWVGKMYFLLGRYDHARLATEPFLRITGEAPHPRILDAARVYAACLSVGDVDLETRLAASRKALDIARQVSRREGWREAAKMAEEFTGECAGLLELLGRYGEAAELAGPGWRGDRWTMNPLSSGVDRTGAALNLYAHHLVTGEVLPPEAITAAPENNPSVGVAPGAGVRCPKNQRILGKRHHNLDLRAALDPTSVSDAMLLTARSGYVIKAVRFVPVVAGGDGAVLRASLSDPCSRAAVVGTAEAALTKVPEGGLRVEPAIPTGMIGVSWCIALADEQDGPPTVVREVRVLPELVKLGPHGSIDVACPETPLVRVEIDGRLARNLPGLVGPLAPGEYAVTLRPVEDAAPYGSWTATVRVEAGKTTGLVGHLPFRPAGALADWTIAPLDPPRQAGGADALGMDPFIFADADGVRLLWTSQRDIWTASSSDGVNFTAPRPVGAPIAGPWSERMPKCVRDESGRYVLLFHSDRDPQAAKDGLGSPRPGVQYSSIYSSWSRDFVRWSKPVRLAGTGTTPFYDACFDARGRIVLASHEYQGRQRGFRVFVSADGAEFAEVGRVVVPPNLAQVSAPRILQRDDGRYELLVLYRDAAGPNGIPPPPRLLRYASNDLAAWQGPEDLLQADLPAGRQAPFGRMAAAHHAGRTVVAVTTWELHTPAAKLVLLNEKEGGGYAKGEWRGLVRGDLALAQHPRWGAMILWSCPSGHEWMPHRPFGPYLLRGKSLETLVQPGPARRAAVGR